MKLVCHLHPHMSEDTASGIPTAIQSLADGFNGNGDQLLVFLVAIFPVAEYRVQIHHKRHVPKDIHRSLLAIHPHLSLVINAIEAKTERLLTDGLIHRVAGQTECLAIPTRSVHGLPRIGIADAKARERSHLPVLPLCRLLPIVMSVCHRLHAEVVRHNNLAPVRIVVIYRLCIDGRTTMKAPALIERLFTLCTDG